MTNLDSIFKSRDLTLPTKVRLVKAMVFPVIMYGCESWTVKNAECRRIDAFELWCWRRLSRVLWTARRSNQSILKEISPGYSLEGLMLKLKLQYFGFLLRRVDSLEKTLMLGGIGGRRRRDDRGWDGWMASLTRWTWVSELRELVMDREAWRAAIHGIEESWTLTDWTELNWIFSFCSSFSSAAKVNSVKDNYEFVTPFHVHLTHYSLSITFRINFLCGRIIKLFLVTLSCLFYCPSCGNLLQYSCLGDPMDRGAWQGYSPWDRKSQTRLTD